MKQFLIWLAFVALIISMPFLIDALVDSQLSATGSNFSDDERQAFNDLVVRSSREAEQHHAKQVKPSLSEQAMIVRDLYGY